MEKENFDKNKRLIQYFMISINHEIMRRRLHSVPDIRTPVNRAKYIPRYPDSPDNG